MDTLDIGTSGLRSSRLVYGCMRIVGDGGEQSRARGKRAIRAAVDNGFTHFDHADIYGGGKCESLFGEVLRESPGLRDRLVITSKCGIRARNQPNDGDPARYDFTRLHIERCVEASLSRLGIETLDILLLHRPDLLLRGEEVAETFRALKAAGKVRSFGVSNFRPSQLTLLQRYCPVPLVMNQVEINIHHVAPILDGTLDQCQELGVTPQAWCPLGGVAYPAWGSSFTPADEARIAAEFALQAGKYGVEAWVVSLAWILALPSKVLPIIGTTRPDRIRASLRALELEYSREDWYRLFEARNGKAVP